MNALADNAFTQTLKRIGESLPRPRAICMVSAHWVTRCTEVLVKARPETIHDFHGFPRELYEIEYPADGSPEEAAAVAAQHAWRAAADWGLDHGTWSVLRHMYPAADVPVFQVSLDAGRGLREHLALGRELRALRESGVLIMGSGNVVHNLRRIDFRPDAAAMDWAVEFDARVGEALRGRDCEAMVSRDVWGEAVWAAAHPTVEHYLPLLYCLGAAGECEVSFPYDGIEHGSISMRMVQFGK